MTRTRRSEAGVAKAAERELATAPVAGKSAMAAASDLLPFRPYRYRGDPPPLPDWFTALREKQRQMLEQPDPGGD